MQELSSTYELCKLGRHAPIQRVLRDGIMRVGKTAHAKVASESLDDWFSQLGDSHMALKLKFYSQVNKTFVLLKVGIDIFDSWKTVGFSAT